MHTVFNIVTTCLLLPFGTLLASLAEKILPEPKTDPAQLTTIGALNEEFRRGRTSLGSAAVHIDLLSQQIRRMVTMAGENTHKAYSVILDGTSDEMTEISATEQTLDTLNKDISQYISKILVHNNSGDNVSTIENYFVITGNAERIGDHAINIAEYIDIIRDKSITFSDDARTELAKMQDITAEAIDKVLNMEEDTTEWLSDISAMEQQMDDMTKSYRETHLERMRQGKCTEEACVLYSELLTDFERIGDHILNIAQAYAKIGQRG